ncbi:MAG: hypothetical protein CL783_00190 [Chloroflexi bacterium]|nr:hypothetical protein [Chloroflexota bacterium]|tara:strand:- start:890 stop:1462 length:573 start_codon:yes stop_codon:yes gene_type:complete
MTLSTAMAVLHKGLLQQVGKPNVVYDNPANTFVARFIGSPSMNIFRMKTNDIWFTTSDPTVRLPRRQETHSAKVQQDVLVGIRPHHFHVVHENDPGISIEVNLVEHLGRSNFVICSPLTSDSFLFEQENIQLETEAAINYEPGAQLRISADPEKITVFDLANDVVECALPSETKNQSKLPKEIPTKEIGQ